jgi:hypothetical protein
MWKKTARSVVVDGIRYWVWEPVSQGSGRDGFAAADCAGNFPPLPQQARVASLLGLGRKSAHSRMVLV